MFSLYFLIFSPISVYQKQIQFGQKKFSYLIDRLANAAENSSTQAVSGLKSL